MTATEPAALEDEPASSERAEKLKNELLKAMAARTEDENDSIPCKPLDQWLSGSSQVKSDILWRLVKNSIGASSDTEPWRQWIRWFQLGPSFRPTKAVLSQDIYWQLILRGLEDTSMEKGKICLFLLRKSLLWCGDCISTEFLSFTKSGKGNAQLAVERYCKAYETIVIGQWIHQVEACLDGIAKEFPRSQKRSSEAFELHPSWWVALLMASVSSAVGKRMADTVGSWVLGQVFTSIASHEQFIRFVSDRLVPWAAQPYLFHDSLVRTRESVQTIHGERLADFIARALRLCPDQGTVKQYLQAVLSKLSQKPRDPRVLGFILQGMDSLDHSTWRALPLGLPDMKLSIDSPFIASVYGISPLTRETKRLCDHHLESLRHVLESIDTPVVLPPLNPAGCPHGSDPISDCVSFEDLCETIINFSSDSKMHFCHLLSAISRFAMEMDSPKLKLDAHSTEDILAALTKIWINIEKSNFSKSSVEILPNLLFGRSMIELSKRDPKLRAFLSSRLVSLQNLSENRIFAWNPLAKAIWKAYLELPGLFSILPIQQFLLKFANQPPQPTSMQLLEYALAQRFRTRKSLSYFPDLANEGKGHAFIFDIINRLRVEDFDFGLSMMNALLKPCLTPSRTHALPKEISVLQAIYVLAERFIMKENDARQYRIDLIAMLKLGLEPKMRFFVEFMTFSALWKELDNSRWRPEELLEVLKPPGDDLSPRQHASLIKVALYISHHKNASEGYLREFLEMLITLGTFEKIVIKREALWTFPHLMNILRGRDIKDITEYKAFKRLEENVRSLKNFQNPPPIRYLESFDPLADRTLATLFEGEYLLLEKPSPLIITVEYFHSVEEQGHGLQQPLERAPNRAVPVGESKPLPPNVVAGITAVATETTAAAPFQSKSFSYEFEDTKPDQRKRDIILVASLIESPFNLGGLCRVSESFGCAELHLADVGVVKDPAFTIVAVSSENHMQLVETPVRELISFCEMKRSESWTIVGVEQTDSSLVLGDQNTLLPKKSVIIMGAEKTGIPPNILVECDFCVEIKQWGETKSLNVQTAAATVLYEWRRQWGSSR